MVTANCSGEYWRPTPFLAIVFCSTVPTLVPEAGILKDDETDMLMPKLLLMMTFCLMVPQPPENSTPVLHPEIWLPVMVTLDCFDEW